MKLRKFVVKEIIPATFVKEIEVFAADEEMALSLLQRGFGKLVKTSTTNHEEDVEFNVTEVLR